MPLDALAYPPIVHSARPYTETRSVSFQHVEAIPEEVKSRQEPSPNHFTRSESGDASQSWFWETAWQQGETEASNDIASRRGDFFESSDAFLEAL